MNINIDRVKAIHIALIKGEYEYEFSGQVDENEAFVCAVGFTYSAIPTMDLTVWKKLIQNIFKFCQSTHPFMYNLFDNVKLSGSYSRQDIIDCVLNDRYYDSMIELSLSAKKYLTDAGFAGNRKRQS